MKKKSTQSPIRQRSLNSAYFEYLETPVVGPDSIRRQPAASNFVDRLRELDAQQKSGFDIASLLIEPMQAGRLYFWNDLHLGHQALEKLRGRSASETDSLLLTNALNTVTKNDILIFGGDVSMTDADVTNAWLRQIPATKILVLGNHDCDKHARTILKLAVDTVVSTIELPGYFITHYPVPEKVMDAARPGELITNLHGHVHASTLNPDEFGSGRRHRNMSVEKTGYRPVTLPDLLAMAI
jgi:calcineurin-like phosphoesterase family protein